MNFYVYCTVNELTEEFYIGSRGCKCLPEDDLQYLGSGKWIAAQKKLGAPLKKEILATTNCRDGAYALETRLIREFKRNLKNRNFWKKDGVIEWIVDGKRLTNQREKDAHTFQRLARLGFRF